MSTFVHKFMWYKIINEFNFFFFRNYGDADGGLIGLADRNNNTSSDTGMCVRRACYFIANKPEFLPKNS